MRYAQGDNASTQTPAKQTQARGTPDGSEMPVDWWSVVNLILLAVFSGLLVWVLSFQWLSMKEGLKQTQRSAKASEKAARATEHSVMLARENARIEQRAWVAVTEASSDVIEGQEFGVRVTFKNTGRTFATNVGIKLVMHIVPGPVVPEFDEAEKIVSILSQGILSPNGICYGYKRSGLILTKGEMEGLKVGQTSVYVHGRIDYTDVFRCPHWTRFCFKLHTNGEDHGAVTYAAYGTRFNQADDNPG